MRFIDEYRDAGAVQRLSSAIHRITTRPWTIMEVCGGQTHAIVRFGIDQLLPEQITLVHGPGCPVCVTSVELVDQAVDIALRPEVIFTSFGDMLRVPGTGGDLLSAKARGADVRVVYSPLDALRLARENPGRQVVFFAVGFETTAPANAMAVYQARQQGIFNFAMLVSHVIVPPAMEAILSSDSNRVQGFLAAGHVCTIIDGPPRGRGWASLVASLRPRHPACPRLPGRGRSVWRSERGNEAAIRVSEAPEPIGPFHMRISPVHMRISRRDLRISNVHMRLSSVDMRIRRLHMRISGVHMRISRVHKRISRLGMRIWRFDMRIRTSGMR